MRSYGFDERIAFSRGAALESDRETIKAFLVGCVKVVKASESDDRAGVDYIATLRKGYPVTVQAKRRDKGCSAHWNGEPQLALEKWSVVERKISGWTLDESKSSELILFSFDPSDWHEAFIVSAQHLRVAFRRYLHDWYAAHYHAMQHTPDRGYHSECVFVPVSVVLAAVTEVSRVSA